MITYHDIIKKHLKRLDDQDSKKSQSTKPKPKAKAKAKAKLNIPSYVRDGETVADAKKRLIAAANNEMIKDHVYKYY